MNRKAIPAAVAMLLSAGCDCVAVSTTAAPPTAHTGRDTAPQEAPAPQPAHRAKLISFATYGNHEHIYYVAEHIAQVESRPFDGIVLDDFISRSLLTDTELAQAAPQVLDSSGSLTYEAAYSDLSPVHGLFHKFTDNFVAVDVTLTGAPPALADDAGWARALVGVTRYAQALRDIGLKGIFLNNEANEYYNYWWGADSAQALLRGQQFIAALQAGYPDITVILAHGPEIGCTAWDKFSGYFGADQYALGSFDAGIISGAGPTVTVIDGDEEYGPNYDLAAIKPWRNGTADQSILQCPFVTPTMAALWSARANLAFTTFDKSRSSSSAPWLPITDVASWGATLSLTLQYSDAYAIHYSQTQDWWGTDTEEALQPWVAVITQRRLDE